ncbi:uncharacterized protein TNCV_394541 [Trichonephila clavipes]|nr:uncharacterized protein TNCV_394541 [Trichonephila clavipes]
MGRIGAPLYFPDISTWGFNLIPKLKEPIGGRRLATREDIDDAVCQYVIRFTSGAESAETDGIEYLPHRSQHVVTEAGDYIEGL